MKHLTKALALVMALACCLIAFGMNTFALDGCPVHPNDYWYGVFREYVNDIYYHDCYCGTCGRLFAVRECLMYNQHDCTTQIECLVCGHEDTRYPKHDAHTWGWGSYNTQYHVRVCTCNDCFVEDHSIMEPHTYIDTVIGGTTYQVCTTCGYNKVKE